jgi:hypothetical protein
MRGAAEAIANYKVLRRWETDTCVPISERVRIDKAFFALKKS